MFRKTVSVLSALCVLCCCLLPAAALAPTGPVAVTLHSDIAGCTQNDADRLIEVKTAGVAVKGLAGEGIYISDFGGTPENGPLVAGRTYFIDYTLSAAPGYTLPETVGPDTVAVTCGKGVSVISTQLVQVTARDDDGNPLPFRGIAIRTKTVVDGSLLQRILGYIHDLILKIRAWSLY